MLLIKKFRIQEIRATNVSIAPFTFILNDAQQPANESFLVMNVEIGNRYHIPMSLDIIGRELVCSFQNREALQDFAGGPNEFITVSDEDLKIVALTSRETANLNWGLLPIAPKFETERTFELVSFGDENGIRLCPFYRFKFSLTRSEYQSCKKLPPNSIFKASFHLVVSKKL